MAAGKISVEKNVVKVRTFHSFVEASAEDRAKVAKLYDDWGTYEQDVKKVNYRGPGEGGILLAQYVQEKSASILDCGSGTGLAGEVLHSLGFTNITALDVSQKSLDIAETKNIYSRIVCTEVGKEQMPFEENEFDALICVGCFIPGHMNQSCFQDWIRVTKPGGIIINVMRETFLDDEDFKGLPKAVQGLVDAKAWMELPDVSIPNYFDGHPGKASVYRVL